MRKIRLSLFFAIGFVASEAMAQSASPLQWRASVDSLGSGVYEIRIDGSLDDQWYVYAETNSLEGIEAPLISWEYSDAPTSQSLRILSKGILLNDPVFNQSLLVYRSRLQMVQRIQFHGTIPANLTLTLHGFAANGQEFLPIEEEQTIHLKGGIEALPFSLQLPNLHLDQPLHACGDTAAVRTSSLWTILLKGFIGGLLALLMPCIFPMLPVTVSFFLHKANSRKIGMRNGLLYAGFIFSIYLLASLPFHLGGSVNPQIFNTISTNVWVNLAFFAIFILFALSLFGILQLGLPGSLVNASEKKSNSATIGGIFFMALTLVIVSFSCTGPILGFLLVNSISGDGNAAMALTAGLGGFGLALAIPFGLFALFPGWLKRLPRSGGWMDTLKKSLAFVELALALKFLSNADLVQHWGWLKREIFIAIWIGITLAMAGYLLGVFNKKVRVPQGLYNADKAFSPKKISWRRGIAVAGILLFAVYLLPGLSSTSYARLPLVSGFPPPLSYSIYGVGNAKGKSLEPDVVNDYEKALSLARQQHKPLLIDFTGWACVNCRKMEENVWSQRPIAQLIRDHFILVSLYVDDRAALPAAQQSTYSDAAGITHSIRSMGDQWAHFQATNFGAASQPQYVLLSPDQELLNHPVGFTPAGKYQQWLECGIQAFKKPKP